jgi:hypothetical protein
MMHHLSDLRTRMVALLAVTLLVLCTLAVARADASPIRDEVVAPAAQLIATPASDAITVTALSPTTARIVGARATAESGLTVDVIIDGGGVGTVPVYFWKGLWDRAKAELAKQLAGGSCTVTTTVTTTTDKEGKTTTTVSNTVKCSAA